MVIDIFFCYSTSNFTQHKLVTTKNNSEKFKVIWGVMMDRDVYRTL